MVFIAAVALVLGVRFGVDAGYFLVMLVNYRLHIVHTTVADLDVVFVKKAVIFICFGKCLEISWRNVLPMLVFTLLLNGGLYQIMFLCLLRLGRTGCLCLLKLSISV